MFGNDWKYYRAIMKISKESRTLKHRQKINDENFKGKKKYLKNSPNTGQGCCDVV